jgi:hypothetical protein
VGCSIFVDLAVCKVKVSQVVRVVNVLHHCSDSRITERVVRNINVRELGVLRQGVFKHTENCWALDVVLRDA